MRRLTVGALVLASVLVPAVVGFAPPAAAQTAGGGELGPDSVRATASDLGAGTFTRFIDVTMAAIPPATVPPKNAVYSPVAATASR